MKTQMVFDSATLLLEICSGETSTHMSKNQGTRMFATSCFFFFFFYVMFITAKRPKLHKCPSTEECLDKLWYIHVMAYCAAIKKVEIGITSPNIHYRVYQYGDAERKFSNICHTINLHINVLNRVGS